MDVLKLIHSSNEIEKRLIDEYSMSIYEMRLRYLVTRNWKILQENSANLMQEKFYTSKSEMTKLDEMYKIHSKIESIVIFGAGVDGIFTLNLLKNSKYKDEKIFFCDNDVNKQKEGVRGIKVISLDELVKNHRESIVIIGSRIYKIELYDQISKTSYPKERILPDILRDYMGWQYFDYFEPKESEVFIDGGSFNGTTSLEFTQWATKGYDYIYSFEANSLVVDNCKETFKKYNLKGEVINKGLWNKSDVLLFDANKGQGSSIKSNGSEKIETISIDEILKGNKATFIKMDIEGAEYNALLGSEKTIKKYRPRLAISVYHKPEDILEIPALLIEMDVDYKFALRQYLPNGLETILYAY